MVVYLVVCFGCHKKIELSIVFPSDFGFLCSDCVSYYRRHYGKKKIMREVI